MTSSIILIGPYGIGKGTLAELLSQKLGWSRYSLDDKGECYLKERPDYEDLQGKRNDWGLLSPEWQQYDAYVVGRSVTEISKSEENRVIDSGAGHSVYEDEEILARVQQILDPHNVVLILPSRDNEESLGILLERTRKRGKLAAYSDEQINEFNRRFIQCNSNYILADLIVYTKGKSPEETCEEILRELSINSEPR
jgi:shikimate kinase